MLGFKAGGVGFDPSRGEEEAALGRVARELGARLAAARACHRLAAAGDWDAPLAAAAAAARTAFPPRPGARSRGAGRCVGVSRLLHMGWLFISFLTALGD